MTPEEEALKTLADEVDKTVRRAAIFEAGVQSEFWTELMEMFRELEAAAFRKFTDTNAADTAVIVELQQIGKLGRVLEGKVKAVIARAEELTQ